MQQAASNIDVLSNAENVKIMSNILKTNVSACSSIGSFFLPQLGRIWLDMLGLYKAVSEIISEQVATQGEIAYFGKSYNELTACRSGGYQDSQSSRPANDQEGDLEARRDVCQKGRRHGGSQPKPYTWTARCYLG
jgi:hypothetical protein